MKIATKGNVRVGDLLRSFHFTGSRRRKHYLYHVVRWNEDEQALEAVPVDSIATGSRSGSYWICSGVGVGAEIVESLFDHLSEDDYQAKLRKIRAKLGNAARNAATFAQGGADVARNDAEHEAKVEAWRNRAGLFRDWSETRKEWFYDVDCEAFDEALRLMRARPAATERDAAAERDCLREQCDYYKADLDAIRAMLPDTEGVSTQDLVRGYVKAAGELLRAAKSVIGQLSEKQDYDDMRAAIEAFERAGEA